MKHRLWSETFSRHRCALDASPAYHQCSQSVNSMYIINTSYVPEGDVHFQAGESD